ncbi:hypothetical protein WJR50_00845 [Catalinimonas sp. 4WD22]
MENWHGLERNPWHSFLRNDWHYISEMGGTISPVLSTTELIF